MCRKLLPVLGLASALAASFPTCAASLKGAAEVLDAANVASIEFAGNGRWYQFGQAPNPASPWPPFDVSRYVADIDYAKGTSRVQIVRKQVVEAGRVRPVPVEQRVDQYLDGAFAWNLPAAGQNGAAPAPQPQPAAAEERAAEIWATPQGFVRAALAHNAKLKKTKNGIEVSFVLDGKHRYVGEINAKNQVERVRTWIDGSVLGDTLVETRYSEYRDYGGVNFPARIERSQGGYPVLDIAVTEVHANPAVGVATPAPVSDFKAPPVAVTQLADGVYYLTGGTHHSVAVEQSKGIVLIEAPLNEQRSAALIAKLKETIPGKPITHLVNTHAHFDHLGGVRTFVAAGAAIVTHQANQAYYRKIWAAPHTLNPDQLAKAKKPARFETFTEKLVLADARHPVEIHAIAGSGHDDAFALAYLPAEKIVVEADAYTPTAADAPPPKTPNPYTVNLYENIQRLKLDVDRIAALHGPRLVTLADLRAAIGTPTVAAAAGGATAKPDDLIRIRQGSYRVIGWHCGRVKSNLDGAFNKDEVLASATVIQSIADAGFGPFFAAGTDKGVGFHESQAKAEAVDPANAVKLAEIAAGFRKEAGELVKVAAHGDKETVKAQFANLTKACKSCHDEFRVKP